MHDEDEEMIQPKAFKKLMSISLNKILPHTAHMETEYRIPDTTIHAMLTTSCRYLLLRAQSLDSLSHPKTCS